MISRPRGALGGLLLLVFASFALPAAGQPVAIGTDSRGLPTLAPILERVTPGVVNIAVRGHVPGRPNPLFDDPFFRRFFNLPGRPPAREFQAAGSGVIVDAENGYVLTNNHVVEKAEEITVTLRDGRRLEAKVVGTDPETDIAVIRIPAENLTALPMGDSDNLKVGDFVIAVGNPFGLGQTVTSGIISALGRTGLGIEGYEDFIQTDASINPGNSGGALVDLRGELIGINTAIVGPSGGNVGIGFAIPVNMARAIMEQLIEHGEVRRGLLGINVQDLTPDIAQALGAKVQSGAVVAQVHPGSAAEKAGLRTGDVIVAINGDAVRSAAELRNRVGLSRAGETVRLDVLRHGRRFSVSVKLAERREAKVQAAELDPRLAGAVFGPAGGDRPGAAVVAVEAGSPAWLAGLRKGDVIVAVNQRPVRTPGEFAEAVRAAKNVLLLNVLRGDAELLIVIR